MSSITGIVRNQVGKALSGSGLVDAIRATALDGGIKEHGWAVASGLGLDSMAVNLAFIAQSKVTSALSGSGGDTLKNAGLLYAAQGGRLTRGHFVWTEGAEKQKFTFPMNPSSISESLSPSWAETMVPGQNRPMYQFVNGGPREVSFTLNFFYQDRKRVVIRDQINALKSLTQRRMTGVLAGAYDGPPAFAFHFGEYFKGERFIMSKIQIKAFDLFDPLSLLPLRADVDLTMLEVVDSTAVRTTGGGENSVNIGSYLR